MEKERDGGNSQRMTEDETETLKEGLRFHVAAPDEPQESSSRLALVS